MSAESTALVQFQFRFSTTADWLAIDPVLLMGEPGVEEDGDHGIKIGDGVRKWSALPYVGGVSVRSVNSKTGEVLLTAQDIPNLQAFIQATIASTLVQGPNVGLAYDQAAGKLTVSASGGGTGGGGVSAVNSQAGAVTITGDGGLTVTTPSAGTVQVGAVVGGGFTGVSTSPGAPTGVSATPGNASATVSWTAPASTGTSPIAGYTVQYSGDGGITWTSVAAGMATSRAVSGLLNGTPYVFRVAAANAASVGPFSDVSAPVTPSSAGPALTGIALSGNTYVAGSPAGTVIGTLSVTPGSVVQYALPAGALNNALFAISQGTLIAPAAITSAVGAALGVRVVATSAAGSITRDLTVTVVSGATLAPTAPGSVTLTPASRSIAAAWAPAIDNGSPVLSYLVEWATTSAGTFVATGSATVTGTSYTIPGLTPGTGYTVRVTARNANGPGPAATATTTTTTPVITISSQPQDATAQLQVAGGGFQASFSVVATVSDGSPLSYQWQAQRPGGQWVDAAAPVSPHGDNPLLVWQTLTLGGLRFLADNGTKVRVRLTADGAAAVVSSEVTVTVPDAQWYSGAQVAGVQQAVPQTSGVVLLAAGALKRTVDGLAAADVAFPGGTVRTLGGAPGKGMAASGTIGTGRWSGDGGVNWSTTNALPVAGGPAGFYARGPLVNGSNESWSTDGLTWTALPFSNPGFGAEADFLVTQTRLLAFSRLTANAANSLWWKPAANPGAAWVEVPFPTGLRANGQWLTAVEIDGLVYVFGRGSIYLVSNPGLTAWTQRAMPYADVFTAAAYGSGMLAVVGQQAQAAVTANPAAADWKIETLPTSGHTAIAFSGGRFVAAGSDRLAIRDVASAIAGGGGIGGGTSVQPAAPNAPGVPTVAGVNTAKYTADTLGTTGVGGKVLRRDTRTLDFPWKNGDFRIMQLDWTAPSSGPTPTDYVVEARLTVGTYPQPYPGTPAPVLVSAGWPWIVRPNSIPTPIYDITRPAGAPATRRHVYRNQQAYNVIGPTPASPYPGQPDQLFWKSGVFTRWDTYQFRVAAKNGTTQGPWSAWSAPFTLKGS